MNDIIVVDWGYRSLTNGRGALWNGEQIGQYDLIEVLLAAFRKIANRVRNAGLSPTIERFFIGAAPEFMPSLCALYLWWRKDATGEDDRDVAHFIWPGLNLESIFLDCRIPLFSVPDFTDEMVLAPLDMGLRCPWACAYFEGLRPIE